ncbi:uncharacterized protein [Typha angustifolia]|uniref:uncharacterized protein n=1 Tax=Typha angustifolia TaxID=59011 RepID=UPI003C302E2F
MLPRRSSAGPGRSPGIPPPFFQFQSPPPPQEAGEGEEAEALSISDQRTLYLVNIFIANTARFLNSFSALCEDKLAHLHRRIVRLDASLTLLEAKIRSVCLYQDIDKASGLNPIASSKQHTTLNLQPHYKTFDPASGPGESSGATACGE